MRKIGLCIGILMIILSFIGLMIAFVEAVSVSHLSLYEHPELPVSSEAFNTSLLPTRAIPNPELIYDEVGKLNYTLVPVEKMTFLRTLLRLTRVAYCVPDVITLWNCGLCQERVDIDLIFPFTAPDHQSAKGYIHVNHDLKSIILSIQGCKFTKNWVAVGLRFWPTNPTVYGDSSQKIQVHRGLYSSWLMIRDLVRDRLLLAHERFPNYDIILQGHSYGAGLVSIAALEFIFQTIPIPVNQVQLYTFGGPRAGNAAYASAINNAPFRAVHRIIVADDVVPHLPSRGPAGHVIFGSFKHFKGEVWLHSRLRKWVFCGDQDGDPEESTICSITVRMKRWSIAQHIAYWDQRPGTACMPVIGKSKGQFLPEELPSHQV